MSGGFWFYTDLGSRFELPQPARLRKWPGRMRKYALARRLDPCPRRHRWFQPGTRGKQYEHDTAVAFRPSGPRHCRRCRATADPVPQWTEFAVSDAAPPDLAYDAFVQGKLNSAATVTPPGMDDMPSFNPARWWFDARRRTDGYG